MNDRRVTLCREALESLLDSISAVSRLERWDAADAKPAALLESANLLNRRLATANGLTSSGFVGSPLVVSRLNGISDAIRRLDRALTEYRTRIEADPEQRSSALDTLEAEIDQARSACERWS